MTLEGPPERMSPRGWCAASFSIGVSGATSRLKAPASRTRRAMSCAYWLPKSRIRMTSAFGEAQWPRTGPANSDLHRCRAAAHSRQSCGAPRPSWTPASSCGWRISIRLQGPTCRVQARLQCCSRGLSVLSSPAIHTSHSHLFLFVTSARCKASIRHRRTSGPQFFILLKGSLLDCPALVDDERVAGN